MYIYLGFTYIDELIINYLLIIYIELWYILNVKLKKIPIYV